MSYRTVRFNLWLPVLILGSFMAMMIASSIWQYSLQTGVLENRTRELLEARMAIMEHRIESLLRLHEDALIAEELAEFGAQKEVIYMALLDADGKIIKSTRRPWLQQPAKEQIPEFEQDHFNRTRQQRLLVMQFDTSHNYLTVYQPITLATLPGQIRPTQTGVLLLRYDLTHAKADIRHNTFNHSISDMVIGGLTMLLLLFVLHRWVTRPLGYLRGAVKRISQGDFSTRIEIHGSGELADLAADINKMQVDVATSAKQVSASFEELRASEENLAVTLNSIGDAVITTDMDGKVTQLNPVAEQLTGWPLADARGQLLTSVFKIVNSQSRLPSINPVKQVLETGDIVGLANHTSLIARDGREYQIADSAAPIRNKAGKVTGVVLVFHDVTRQYRQQALIAAREAELRKITSILPGPVSHLDHHGRYIFVSEVFASWFGKPAEEVIGQTQLEVLGEELYAQIQPYIFRARNGEPVNFEITIPTTAAGPRHTLVHVIPDVDDEAVRGLFIIGMDISQLKLAEQEAHELRDQLIQATKMEAVGHLTAGIAHDFNNMLGAILGYTELTQHVIASGKLQDTGTYLAAILKAGNRAKELIAQMLTFSRKSTMAADDVPVVLLAPILKEVVSLLRSSIPSTIDLNYQLSADDLQACIHPVHLHQIIVNLGINARDAMGEYGKINIRLSSHHGERVCNACKHPFSGNYVQLTVQDSGSGISKDIQARIFDPFFTTKGVGKGTGMGLSVVHGLVHAVGGHIQVESDGSGTAISILLPVVNASLTATDATPYSLPKSQELLKNVRIFVVDDEPAMATMVQELLSLHGANVTQFNNPHQALASFEKSPDQVDLVITDETMPGLSGMHLATKMLAIKPSLPIVLCTGYSENTNAETAEAHGLAGFFYKPVKMNELLQKLQQILQTGR